MDNIPADNTLLRERDTLLARLEGWAELPKGYEITQRDNGYQPYSMAPSGHTLTLWMGCRSFVSDMPDTPENRRILTAIAWAHWHATGGSHE